MKKSAGVVFFVLFALSALFLFACAEEPLPTEPLPYEVQAPFEERDGVIYGTVANCRVLPLSDIVTYAGLCEAQDEEGCYYPVELYPEAGENRYTLFLYGTSDRSVSLVIENAVFDSLRAEPTKDVSYRIGEPIDLSAYSFWGYAENEKTPLPASLIETEYLFDSEGEKEIWFSCGGKSDCLTTVVSGVYEPVLDADGKADGIYYRFSEDGMAVCDGTEAKNAVCIPETVSFEGVSYPVTSIEAFAFKENKNITALSCLHVSLVGESAFCGCTALKNVRLPDKSCAVGANAFSGCVLLESVTVPFDLTVLPDGLFCDCASLSYFSFPEMLSEIGSGAFMRCTALCSVTVPESVRVIGDFAFKGCESLSPSVVLGADVSYIGTEAFASCESLLSLVVPGSVETIGEDAFLSSSLTVYTTKGTTTAVTCMRAGVPYVKWNVNSLGVVGYKTEYAIGDTVEPEDYLAVWMGEDRIYRPGDITVSCDLTVAGTRTVRLLYGESLGKWQVNVSYTEPIVAFTDTRGAVYEIDEFDGTAKLVSLPEKLLPSEVCPFAEGVYVLPTELVTSGGERYAVTAVGTGVFFGRADIKAIFLHDGVKAIEANAVDACPNLILFYLSVPAGKGVLLDDDNLKDVREDLLAVCALRNSITHIWIQQHKIAFVGLDAEPDYGEILNLK